MGSWSKIKPHRFGIDHSNLSTPNGHDSRMECQWSNTTDQYWFQNMQTYANK